MFDRALQLVRWTSRHTAQCPWGTVGIYKMHPVTAKFLLAHTTQMSQTGMVMGENLPPLRHLPCILQGTQPQHGNSLYRTPSSGIHRASCRAPSHNTATVCTLLQTKRVLQHMFDRALQLARWTSRHTAQCPWGLSVFRGLAAHGRNEELPPNRRCASWKIYIRRRAPLPRKPARW
jgi:hypothetical protein